MGSRAPKAATGTMLRSPLPQTSRPSMWMAKWKRWSPPPVLCGPTRPFR